MSNLRLFFFLTLLDWMTAFRNLSFFSIVDLLDLCNFRYIHFYYLLKKRVIYNNDIDHIKISIIKE